MSEFINNSEHKQEKLKEIIKQLHHGKTVDEVKRNLKNTLVMYPQRNFKLSRRL